MPWCLSIDFLSFPFSHFFPVYGRQVDTVKCKCDEPASTHMFVLSLIQSSLPAQSVAILSQAFPLLCHSHLCFHLELLHGSSLNSFACVECHHLVLLHLITFLSVSITAVDFSSQAHPTARHILSAITSYRKGKPICTHVFLAVLQVLPICRPMFQDEALS